MKNGMKSKKSRTIEKHNNQKMKNHPPSHAKILNIMCHVSNFCMIT